MQLIANSLMVEETIWSFEKVFKEKEKPITATVLQIDCRFFSSKYLFNVFTVSCCGVVNTAIIPC